MAKLKLYNKLTLVFKNGILVKIFRSEKEYMVSDLEILEELKRNLKKRSLSLIDLEQLINLYSPKVKFKIYKNKIVLKNVNLE